MTPTREHFRNEMLSHQNNWLSKAGNFVGDTYDKYLEDPLRKMPRWGQIAGFAGLNMAGTYLGNQMPWVSEENQANPLLAAAIATPMELLQFDYINAMKDKYKTTKTSEAMFENSIDLAYNMARSPANREKKLIPMIGTAISEFAEPFKDIYKRSNTLTKAGIMGSIVGSTAQLPISAYNSVMSLTGNKGAEINNDVGTAVGFGLGAIAPITMSLLNKARGK